MIHHSKLGKVTGCGKALKFVRFPSTYNHQFTDEILFVTCSKCLIAYAKREKLIK